jgi:hypothetical protein
VCVPAQRPIKTVDLLIETENHHATNLNYKIA